MLKHRVQTTAMPNAQSSAGSCSNTQNISSNTIVTCYGAQPTVQTGTVNCSKPVEHTTTDNYKGSQQRTQHDNTDSLRPQYEQHGGYIAPPPVTDNANCNSQQTVRNPDHHGYKDQQYIPYTSPSHSVNNSPYHSTADSQQLMIKSQDGVPPLNVFPQDEKDGVRLITEKYDSFNKLSISPQKSPLGSPCSDGGKFSFTDMIMSQKFREGVTEQDLLQVDTFYRSHKSEVYVCACLVNMYFGSAKAALNNDQWTFSNTGIPLLLLDTGEHHRERKLYIILAEKGTGFTMWRDVIDNQTGYRTPNANFHTMHTSKDHSQLAGFSFDDAKAASEFYGHIHKLTDDPDDDLLKIGKFKKKKSIKDKKKKVKLPKKTEISQPCCFVHVTKLDRPISEENETSSSTKNSNPNEISAPFNFQHVTGPPGSGNDLSNLMGSKITLTSTSSVDSGLSDDRGSAQTGH